MSALILLLSLIQPPESMQFKTTPTDRSGVVEKSFSAELMCWAEEGQAKFGVSASYPQLKASATDAAVTNKLIEQEVFKMVGLDASCDPLPAAPLPDMDTFNRNDNCEVTRLEPGFASISCHLGWDGGAHPYEGVASLNIDRRRGRLVANDELFIPGTTGELWAVIRKHAKMLDPDEGESSDGPFTGYVVQSLSDTVWFTKSGAHFECYWGPDTYVADVPYSEIRPLLNPSVAEELE